MKHWIAKAAVSCFFAVSMLAAAPPADAARMESYNLIWFDSSGNVIGQHAEFCNNYQLEGGAQSGAFALSITGGCGDLLRFCEQTDKGYICYGFTQNIGLSATVSGNAGNLSAGDLCELTGACSGTEPILMVGHGFDIVQIYPVPKKK
ncbi:TPA: hypothetical protein QEL15_000395 [Stenotrophomonas maltophilia]|nr:hypothetical protein [Stenotrophomonas maltophilia]